MKRAILFVLTAAFSLSACDLVGFGRSEKGGNNQSTEENSSSNSSSGNSSRNEDEGRSSGGDEDRGSADDRDSGSRGDEGSSDEGDSSRASSGDPQLERELQAAVRGQQSRLPMRDGPGVITAMEAEGTRLVVTMEIEDDFGQAQWDQMAAALQRNICNDRNSRRMIERGAEVVYQITDGDGQRVNMTTNRCD